MIIRAATKEDVPVFLSFITEWTVYQMEVAGFKFDEEIFKKHLLMLIEAGNALAVEEGGNVVGGVGGRLNQSFYTKDIIFDVITMYIQPEHRHLTANVLAALKSIMALTSGVTKLVVCSPAFFGYDKVNRYYKIKGFRLLQMNFITDIKHEVPNAR